MSQFDSGGGPVGPGDLGDGPGRDGRDDVGGGVDIPAPEGDHHRFLFLDQGAGRKRLVIRDGRALTTKDGAPCCCDGGGGELPCDAFGPCSRLTGSETREILINQSTACAAALSVTIEWDLYWVDNYLWEEPSFFHMQDGSDSTGKVCGVGFAGAVRVTDHDPNGVPSPNPMVWEGSGRLGFLIANSPFRPTDAFVAFQSDGQANVDPYLFSTHHLDIAIINAPPIFNGLRLFHHTLFPSDSGPFNNFVRQQSASDTSWSGSWTHTPTIGNCAGVSVSGAWSLSATQQNTPGGTAGAPSATYPAPVPQGCPGGDPPDPVEGYIPNEAATGSTLEQPEMPPLNYASWVNRVGSVGAPDGSFGHAHLALQAVATRQFVGLIDFVNDVPVGATITGCKLDLWIRHMRAPNGSPINDTTMQWMRLWKAPEFQSIPASQRPEPVVLQVAGVFPSQDGSTPWTKLTFGPDLWGLPQSFWDDPATISAINSGNFGFGTWLRLASPSGSSGTGNEYQTQIDAAFMEILYQLPSGASGSIIAPAGCVGCGGGPGIDSL